MIVVSKKPEKLPQFQYSKEINEFKSYLVSDYLFFFFLVKQYPSVLLLSTLSFSPGHVIWGPPNTGRSCPPPPSTNYHLSKVSLPPLPGPCATMRRAVSKFIPRARPASDPSTYKIDQSSVEDFYILLDDPHKSWLPGEEILGQVILISRKNLANIAIVFSLTGYVKINALHHSKLRAMKHVLFNHNIKIYGPDTDLPTTTLDDFVNGLYKGEHRFPFIVKLPNKRVYTSLDFGKGSIEYVLKTSLRSADAPMLPEVHLPGPIPSPTSSDLLWKAKAFSKFHTATFKSEKIINLVNPIDVAQLPPLKPKRLIIKDPRHNKKLLRVQSSTSTINTFSTMSSNNSDNESIQTAHTGMAPGVSANTPSLLLNAHLSLGNASSNGISSPLMDHRPNHIRITMEIGQRGFLRGELIPIKLSINHLKQIQDSRGIIVTLVRVCRLDYGPDGFYESFRKDLQQLVIPLFVDPNTFSLEINTSLRVPPDAFPTILGCPMVSFQYFIEVMLNLSGKSLSLDGPSEHPKSSIGPHDDILTSAQGSTPGAVPAANYNFHTYATAQNRSEFINTDKFKRLKKFLQITSEVVIGTHRLEKPAIAPSPDPSHSFAITPRRSSLGSSNANSPAFTQPPPAIRAQLGNIDVIPESGPMDFSIPPYLESTSTIHSARAPEPITAPIYEDISERIPMPQQPNLSEKERMRLHEASLLPSEPHFDHSDGEDRETVSPMDPSNDILDELISQGNLESGNGVGSDRDMYFSSIRRPPGESPQAFREADDLYDPPDIHEGIGLEGAKEYVPNYDNSGNDRLVITGDQENQSN